MNCLPETRFFRKAGFRYSSSRLEPAHKPLNRLLVLLRRDRMADPLGDEHAEFVAGVGVLIRLFRRRNGQTRTADRAVGIAVAADDQEGAAGEESNHARAIEG